MDVHYALQYARTLHMDVHWRHAHFICLLCGVKWVILPLRYVSFSFKYVVKEELIANVFVQRVDWWIERQLLWHRVYTQWGPSLRTRGPIYPRGIAGPSLHTRGPIHPGGIAGPSLPALQFARKCGAIYKPANYQSPLPPPHHIPPSPPPPHLPTPHIVKTVHIYSQPHAAIYPKFWILLPSIIWKRRQM